MAFVHVDEIQYLDLITLFFEQIATIPKHFRLRVQYHIAAGGIHEIDFGKESGFTGTAAAAAEDVQIAPVFSSVQSHGYMPGQGLVFAPILVSILPVECFRTAPFGRTMLFPPAVVPFRGKVYADPQAIDQKKNEDRA